MEIRVLREDDERSLRSGDTDLDRFFRQFAGQNQFRHYLGVTFQSMPIRRRPLSSFSRRHTSIMAAARGRAAAAGEGARAPFSCGHVAQNDAKP